ncbi:MAG: DUF3783 domain-containing protein [Clostridiaceae bacterium]|nr:DUF3783 domain-containing protein [Clostridiaceae bacterium]
MIERQCIILCNFNEKEKKLLKSYGMMMGLKDQINVSYKNSETILKNILDGNLLSDAKDGIKDRAIIFNNISEIKVSMFIDNMKKMRIAPSMKAVVTETSVEWTLNELLENLKAERRAEKKGKILEHH